MKTLSAFAFSALLLACGRNPPDDYEGNASTPQSMSSSSSSSSGGANANGLPCERAHGTATLAEYTGENYALASFSFELGTQDVTVTHNAPDVYYERNAFMVGGDRATSFVVDLGAIDLRDVPSTVNAEDYPTGTWGTHDAIQAHPGHVYFLRGRGYYGRVTAAFRVTAIDPGRHVTLEWIRSSDPDVLVVPTACLSGG